MTKLSRNFDAENSALEIDSTIAIASLNGDWKLSEIAPRDYSAACYLSGSRHNHRGLNFCAGGQRDESDPFRERKAQ